MDAATRFQPMSVGRILDRVFFLYKEHFLRFIVIVAVVHVPLTLLGIVFKVGFGLGMGGQDVGEGAMVAAGLAGIVGGLLSFVAQTLAGAALTKNVSEAYMDRESTVGECYRDVWRKVWSLVGASILIFLAIAGGMILFVVPGVIFMLWFALTVPVIVVERNRAVGAMKRSRWLVAGNLGKVFGVLVVVTLIQIAVGSVFSGAGQGVTVAAGGGLLMRQTVSSLCNLVGTILTAPLTAGAHILLYYDMRIRKEGFDLEMLADSLGDDTGPGDPAGQAGEANPGTVAEDENEPLLR